MHNSDLYSMKAKVVTGLNREMHKIKKEVINPKQLELNNCYCLLKKFGKRGLI